MFRFASITTLACLLGCSVEIEHEPAATTSSAVVRLPTGALKNASLTEVDMYPPSPTDTLPFRVGPDSCRQVQGQPLETERQPGLTSSAVEFPPNPCIGLAIGLESVSRRETKTNMQTQAEP